MDEAFECLSHIVRKLDIQAMPDPWNYRYCILGMLMEACHCRDIAIPSYSDMMKTWSRPLHKKARKSALPIPFGTDFRALKKEDPFVEWLKCLELNWTSRESLARSTWCGVLSTCSTPVQLNELSNLVFKDDNDGSGSIEGAGGRQDYKLLLTTSPGVHLPHLYFTSKAPADVTAPVHREWQGWMTAYGIVGVSSHIVEHDPPLQGFFWLWNREWVAN